MKKILFFIGSMLEGGAERVVSILSNSLIKEEYDIEILMYLDNTPFYDLDPKIKLNSVCKNTGSRSLKKNFFWIRRYLNNNFDVVISFLSPFNMLMLTCSIGKGIPIIVADRNDPSKVPGNSISRIGRNILYHYSAHIVVQTNKNFKYFSNSLKKKISIIPNPVNKIIVPDVYSSTTHQKVIVTVGRLIPQKNQQLLLDAFKIIHDKYPDYKLVIYGEGELRGKYENFINDNGLSEYILLPGVKKNIYDLLSKAEIFVLPSLFEGMPNALIEAMCIGMPVVSTRVSGADEIIKTGYNGILINNDIDEMIDALEKLINNPTLRSRYGANASKLAWDLSESKITENWKMLIEQIIRNKI
jgi:glycosyltransferase involved in cell wall biosynthesis